MVDRSGDTSKIKSEPTGKSVYSRVDSLYPHLKEVQSEGGNGRKEAARVHRSRTVMRVVEDGVVRRILRLHLPEFLRIWNPTVEEKRVLGFALVASIFPWLLWSLRAYLHIKRTWMRNAVSMCKL